jgi:hypothetical protein
MDAQALVQQIEKLNALEGPLKEGVEKLKTDSEAIKGLTDGLLALYSDTATQVTAAVEHSQQALTEFEHAHNEAKDVVESSQSAVDGSVATLKTATAEHKETISTAAADVTKAKESYAASLKASAEEHKNVAEAASQSVKTAYESLQTHQQSLGAVNQTLVAHMQEYKSAVETTSQNVQAKANELTQHMSEKDKEMEEHLQTHRTALADTHQALAKHLQETLTAAQTKARELAEEVKRKHEEHKQLLTDAKEHVHTAATELTDHAHSTKNASSAAEAQIAPMFAEHAAHEEKLHKGSQEAQKARASLGI